MADATEKLRAEAAAKGLVLLGTGKDCNYRRYRFEACGHEQEIQTGAARRGEFRCQQCLDLKLEQEAATQGLVLLGSGRGRLYRQYHLACGHEQEIQIGNVRRGEFRCQQCLDLKLEQEAATQGLVLLGSGRNAAHRRYKLSCGHEQEIDTGKVRIGKFRCQACLDLKLEQEAAAQGLVLLGSGRNCNYRRYKLTCGHEQEIDTGKVRIGNFRCQTCEMTHMDQPSAVYANLVEAPRHGFPFLIKLGKGKPGGLRTAKQDRASDDDVLVHRAFEIPVSTGREALEREQAFHKAARRARLTPFTTKNPCAWYPDGGTELYPVTEKLMRLLAEHFPEAPAGALK